VLRTHLSGVLRWRNHQMWLMAAEAVASLVWVFGLCVALAIAVLSLVITDSAMPGLGLSWGVAICVVATVQVTAALLIETPYDPRNWRAFLVEPLYPVIFWLLSAGATLRSQTVGLIRGPRSSRVVWDVPREEM
jgi:poly-beta-1,6-N-acetyl-D-glucosamine synthase